MPYSSPRATEPAVRTFSRLRLTPSPPRARRALSSLAWSAHLVLLGCSQGGRTRTGDIGIAVALDPQRAGMQSIYNGVQLAVDQLNTQAAGKLGGSHIRMVRGSPTERDAVKIADFLRADPSVVGVVGHPESGTTLAAIDEYADTKNEGRDGVVTISPTGTAATLSGANRWLFRVCPNDLQVSRAVARFLIDSLRAMRAAVIYRNDAYGKDWAKSFGDAYREGSGVIVERDPYLQNVTAWDAYAGYIRQLHPDVVLFPGSTEDAVLALRAIRAAGVNIPFVGGDATSGLEANAAEFPNARYTAFFLARRAESPEARSFVTAYTAAYKEPPDQRAALSYDAAMLIGRAILEVGPDRAKIRDYVESIGTSRPAMPGVAGAIAFDAKHDAVNKPVVVTRLGQ